MVLQTEHLMFPLLIYTLCYIAPPAATIHGILFDVNDAETCNLLCEQCNASAIFLDDHCECNFTGENDKDVECIQRIQKEIQTIELNVLSDDLTDEERIVRSILKSRRRLRTGDADKVAQYFISGGPSAGRSPFIKYNAYESTTNSDVADDHNPENKFYDISQSSISPVSQSTYNPPLYAILEAAKQKDPARERPSLLGITNSILNYPTSGWYGLMSPLLGSAAQPYGPYGHGSPLHHSLLRTATLPTQVLQNFIARRLSKYPAYYGDLVKGTIPSQDVLSSPFIDRSYKYADNAGTSHDSSTARTNDKSVAASVTGSDFPIQSAQFVHMPYIFGTDTLHDPMQYRYFASLNSLNSQYPYYNPLINILHPLDGYILRPISQSTANQINSVSPNPIAYHANNAKFERQSDVSVVTDKTVNTDEAKGLNNVNIASKEGKKIENNADSNVSHDKI